MAQIRVNNDLVKPKGINVFKDGQWLMKKKGKVFHNGLWLDFIQYNRILYENGNNYDGLKINYNQGTIEFRADSIYFSTTNANNQASVASLNRIDVTDYNKLCMEVSANNGGFGLLGLDASNSFVAFVNWDVKLQTASLSTSKTIYTIDISGVSGSFYVLLGHQNGQTNVQRSMNLYRAWLE